MPRCPSPLEPGEVLQVVGEDCETVVRRVEKGILAEDRVPVAFPVQGGPHPVLATALPISLTMSAVNCSVGQIRC